MDYHYITYTLNILLLFVVPIGLAIYLVKKFDLEGRHWWIALGVFILAFLCNQVFDNFILNPVLNGLSSSASISSTGVLVIGALAIGLSSAVWVELFRYGMFRWWTKDAKVWEDGILLGTGSGSGTAFFYGFLVIYNFVNMSLVRNSDLTKLVTPDQVPVFQAALTSFWSASWLYTFREAIEQLLNLVIQIGLALLVMQVFNRRQLYWLFLAIGLHLLAEAGRVLSLNLGNEYVYMLVLLIFAIISAGIAWALRRPVLNPDPATIPGSTNESPLGRSAQSPKSVEEMVDQVKSKK